MLLAPFERRQCDLAIGHRILRTLESGAAPPDGGLCMMHRATIPVERRSEADALNGSQFVYVTGTAR
jgi:hypothetical protein